MKIEFGGNTYDVLEEKKLPGGIVMYAIEDEPGHIDLINPDGAKIVEP